MGIIEGRVNVNFLVHVITITKDVNICIYDQIVNNLCNRLLNYDVTCSIQK